MITLNSEQSDYRCPEMPITASVEADPSAWKAIPTWLRWRTGRKVGRTIYAQIGSEPSDEDRLIGMMDTPSLAEEAVRSHNVTLRKVQT